MKELIINATVLKSHALCHSDFDFMKVVLFKALFIIIKANSSYQLDQRWRRPGGEATHESKELQQDDSNPESIF